MSTGDIVNELNDRLSSTGDIDRIMMIQTTDTVARIVSLVTGILSVIIVIMIPLIVVLEVLYICFPVIREAEEKMIFKLEQMGVKHNPLGFVLRDAREAINQSTTDIATQGEIVGGRSALYIYIKIKAKSIMFVMFVVIIALRGPLLTSYTNKLFTGIIEAIVKFFYTI